MSAVCLSQRGGHRIHRTVAACSGMAEEMGLPHLALSSLQPPDVHSGQNLNFKPREASGTSQFSKEGSNWVSTATENFNGKCRQPCKTGRQGPLLPYPLPLFSPSPAPSFPLPRKSRHRKRKTNKTGTALPSLSSWNHLASPDSFPHFFGPRGAGLGLGWASRARHKGDGGEG